MIGPVYTFRPCTNQKIMLNIRAAPKTATDQFIVCAVGFTVEGQNEKKIPITVYMMERMVIGMPARPSLKGPQII